MTLYIIYIFDINFSVMLNVSKLSIKGGEVCHPRFLPNTPANYDKCLKTWWIITIKTCAAYEFVNGQKLNECLHV